MRIILLIGVCSCAAVREEPHYQSCGGVGEAEGASWKPEVPVLPLPDVPATADDAEAYRLGASAYDDADFARAAAYFKRAFEHTPRPAYLFNLAQAYRLGGDCKTATFFYKRHLALAPTHQPSRDHLEALGPCAP